MFVARATQQGVFLGVLGVGRGSGGSCHPCDPFLSFLLKGQTESKCKKTHIYEYNKIIKKGKTNAKLQMHSSCSWQVASSSFLLAPMPSRPPVPPSVAAVTAPGAHLFKMEQNLLKLEQTSSKWSKTSSNWSKPLQFGIRPPFPGHC